VTPSSPGPSRSAFRRGRLPAALFRALGAGVAGFGIALALKALLLATVGLETSFQPLYLGVAAAAGLGGFWGGVASTVLGSLLQAVTLSPTAALLIVTREDAARLILFVAVALTISAITGRLLHERRRAIERGERYARLRDVVGEMARATSASQVATLLLRAAPGQTAPTSGGLALWNEEHTALDVIARDPRGETLRHWSGRTLPSDAGLPVVATARDGVPRWFANHQDLEAAFPALVRQARTPLADAAIVVPLVLDDRAIGSAWLSYPAGVRLGDEDRAFAAALAGHAGQALERVRLFEAEHAARVRAEAAELAVARSLATTAAVVTVISDPVFVVDADRRIILWNPSAERILGDRPGDTLDDLLAHLGDKSASSVEERDLERGITLHLPEQRLWLEARMTRLDPAIAILELRDITTLEETAAAHEAFLGVLSHELRTPVTSIYGLAQYLDRPAHRERSTELAGDIKLEADRLKRLVDDLLVLSRVERDRLETGEEPVLLQRLLPRVVEAERRRTPEPGYRTLLPSDLPPVLGDETYVEQVVRNLVANAAKYGPSDGAIQVTGSANETTVTIRVLDDGPGFADEDADQLFDLFYRAAPSARHVAGAGIGLFVVRQLVQTMGGRIWARRRPEGGAEFGFELRRVEPGEPVPEPAGIAGSSTKEAMPVAR
jgi:K+-sensing histidine kinase KdpD